MDSVYDEHSNSKVYCFGRRFTITVGQSELFTNSIRSTLPLKFRYLLPARKDFKLLAEIEQDQNYKQFFDVISRAVPFPNRGYPQARESLSTLL